MNITLSIIWFSLELTLYKRDYKYPPPDKYHPVRLGDVAFVLHFLGNLRFFP